jgi:hypothetical protein
MLDDAAAQCLVRFAQLMQERKELTIGLMRSAIGKARGLVLRLSLVLECVRISDAAVCYREAFDRNTSARKTWLSALQSVLQFVGICFRSPAPRPDKSMGCWLRTAFVP